LLACNRGESTPKLSVETESGSAPRVVTFDPPLGAADVDPARTTLSVTFDRPMDREGWAWVIENKSTAPDIGESSWDTALRTNTTKVRLEPGRSYVVWVNSPQYLYFKDAQGRTATPVRWTFTTRGTSRTAPTMAPLSAHGAGTMVPGSPPRVVRLEPGDGATGVDPATTQLRVTFDRAMAEGWSWVIEQGATFPESTGDASMSADLRQAMLPVKLRPGTTYVVWLNSQQHRDFADRAGVPLAPTRWSFTTRDLASGR
jgi:RNA polymerase sigma-70 factor (ECF subfamily)